MAKTVTISPSGKVSGFAGFGARLQLSRAGSVVVKEPAQQPTIAADKGKADATPLVYATTSEEIQAVSAGKSEQILP